MKYFIYCMVIACFVSCSSVSKDDKEGIEFSINIKNNNNKLKYGLDLLDKQLAISKELREKGFDEAMINTLKTNMAKFSLSTWNEPYDIRKDTALTLNSYLEYCKTFNYDPKTYINILMKD